jgi:hypothetical protein
MDFNKEKNNIYDNKRGFLKAIDDENLNKLLCCSDNFYSIKDNEQLSEEEVKDLWLKIIKNL